MRALVSLNFAMVFTYVRLQPSDKSCFQASTGINTGGSCDFRGRNLCNWTNSEKDQSQWTFEEEGILARNFGKNENDRTWLIGPTLCESERTDLCMTITYQSDGNYGAQLSLYVCKFGSSEDVCSKDSQPVWSTKDWDEDIWHVRNISFNSPGKFQMLIEAKKHKDWKVFLEADVYISSVRYKNTSCNDEQQVPSTTEQTTLQTTIDETTIVSLEVTTVGTESNTHQPTETAEHEDKAKEAETSSPSIIVPVVIAASVAMLVVALTIIIVVAVVFRRRTSKANHGKKASDAVYRRNDSMVVVTNELYGATGGHSFLSPEESAGFLSEMQPLPRGTQTPSPTTDNDSLFYSAVDKGKKAQGSSTAHLQIDPVSVTKSAAQNPAAAENDYENTGVKPSEVVYYNVARENQDHQQDTYDHLNDLKIKVKPA